MKISSATVVHGNNYSQEDINAKNSTNDKTTNSSKEQQLTPTEQALVSKLQQRDTEVRAHESAHMSSGVASGGATFTYQKGPDGRQYAVGGEVPIDVSGGASTPEDKIAHAQKVRAAALAPSSPSPADMQIAATASMMEIRARVELTQEKAKEYSPTKENPYSQLN